MKKYLKIWLLLSKNSFETFAHYRLGALVFFLGKIARFLFFLLFLVFLTAKVEVLSGYNVWQVLLIYMTFNFIDASTQMLFREVYRFKQHIITGNFDMLLVKPVNVLFRLLLGGTDLLDFITLLPFILILAFIITKIPDVSFIGILFYIILIINSLIIAASFHIFVMALAVLTSEVDNAVMIYRDITGMGKLPVDIYKEPLRSFITFVVPVGVMMTIPVKVISGLVSLSIILVSLSIGVLLFLLSLKTWDGAIKKYTSASS